MGEISGNLFASLPSSSSAELVETLVQNPGIRIERIVSTGQATPPGEWYDQPTDEWVSLLSGSATLQVEGEPAPRQLVPGDWIMLPAHCRHRVEATSATEPTIWLAVHHTPQTGQNITV
jgi:cupin 2 domain-containing protein